MTQPPPWIQMSTAHRPPPGGSPSGVMTWQGTPAIGPSTTDTGPGGSPCNAARPANTSRAWVGVISSRGGLASAGEEVEELLGRDVGWHGGGHYARQMFTSVVQEQHSVDVLSPRRNGRRVPWR